MTPPAQRGWKLGAPAVLLATLLAACGGGSSPPPPARHVTITGTVSAPGGALALGAPRGFRRWLREVVLGEAYAAASDVAPVGSGVAVALFQIGADATPIGSAIATGTTNGSGQFTLQAPAGFTPSASYVVRAGTGTTLDAFATSTGVTVTPYSQATVTLITSAVSSVGGRIDAVSAADVAAVLQVVLSLLQSVPPATTVGDLVAALTGAAQNSVEANNVVTSIPSEGSIAGTVSMGGAPLAGVQIMVRPFGVQLLQALTRTDASGRYEVHVPSGRWIVGAVNDGTTSTAGSAFWKASGAPSDLYGADPITVGTGAVAADFALAAGGRIQGTVAIAGSSAALAGVHVDVQDFPLGMLRATVESGADGSYALNVPPGAYYVNFRNSTLQPYASQTWNPALASGGVTKNQAAKITIAAGASVVADGNLQPGYAITGTVTEGSSGDAPVAGQRVLFLTPQNQFAEYAMTGLDGKYRIVLRPATYAVKSRGQSATVNVTTAGQTQLFGAATSRIVGKVQDAAGHPVSSVFGYLFDPANAPTTPPAWVAYEPVLGDGSFTEYAIIPSHAYVMQVRIDDGRAMGSIIYDGQTQLLQGTPMVSPPAAGGTTDVGTFSLPEGAVLKGTVTKGGAPAMNAYLQVRVGGLSGSANVFVTTQTMSDGSYTISLPAGLTVARLCAAELTSGCPSAGAGSGAATNLWAFVDGVTMGAAGTTKVQDLAY